MLDDFRIYNCTLSADRIEDVMSGGFCQRGRIDLCLDTEFAQVPDLGPCSVSRTCGQSRPVPLTPSPRAPAGAVITGVGYDVTISGSSMYCSDYGVSIACCGFKPGDRVMLLTNYPRGAVGLVAGMQGTVICCDSTDPELPIFVSWDGWTNGRNTDTSCDCPPSAYTPNSGWWVGCLDIRTAGGRGSCDVDLYDVCECSRAFSPQVLHAGLSGQQITMYFTLANPGTQASAETKIRFYASPDATMTTSDYMIGQEGTIPSIAPGATLSCYAPREFPTTIPAGTYYVGWIIDPCKAICETNRSNNTAYKRGYQLTVLGARDASCLDGRPLEGNSQ